MRDWIVVVILYLVGVGLFRILGGFSAAAGVFRSWGRASSAIGHNPGSS